MQEPTIVHWQATNGLLRYVTCSKEHGIVYGKDPGTVIGYSDTDYAGDRSGHETVHHWLRLHSA